MPDLDAQELARSLEKTAGYLKQHIAAEGKRVGDAHGRTYAKAAQEQIREAKADAERWKECNAELRRQMEVLACRSAAYLMLEKFLKDITHASDGADVPIGALTDALAASRAAGDAEYKRQQKVHAADG